MTPWLLLAACAVLPSGTSAGAPDPAAPAAAVPGVSAPALPATVGQIPAPAGYTRVPSAPGSFGAWLEALPLYPPDRQVLSHRGDPMTHMPAWRVVDMPVGDRDLQQCADSLLRLRADWLRSIGRNPAFRYTSGDLSSWADYAAGWRLRVSGNTVSRVKSAAPDASEANYDRWLMDLFTYAGTRSLPADSLPDASPDPGDFLLISGSPGHAVMILGVAARADVPAGGGPYGGAPDRLVMVGQGFMPAMDFHIVIGDVGGADGAAGPWHRIQGETLDIMQFPMPWSNLRRWPDP